MTGATEMNTCYWTKRARMSLGPIRGGTRRVAFLGCLAIALMACEPSFTTKVPYRTPSKVANASTMVVYQRGGFLDYFVVLDGQQVMGVTTRNGWIDVNVPDGEHDIVLVMVDDPDNYRKVLHVDEYPCYRIKTQLASDRTYYLRIGFISFMTPTLAPQQAALEQKRADLSQREEAAERSKKGGSAQYAAESQTLATQEAGAGISALIINGGNDPDAKPPVPPEDVGWTVRLIKDASKLGPQRTERLKEWDHVALANPAKAQAWFDRIRRTLPLRCMKGGPPVITIGPDDHLQ